MFTLPNVSKPGLHVFGIPALWFRKVTAYLTNICAGTGIRITQPGEPSASAPVKIEIDPDWLRAQMPRATAPDSETGGDASAEDATEASTPAVPSLLADDDSADFTSGGDTLSDGDAIDTINHPDAANDTTRWMNNAAANALGSYDADNDTPSGDWTGQTTLETDDASVLAFDPTADASAEWQHHAPIDLIVFARDKLMEQDGAWYKLLFARKARVDATGKVRYVSAEYVIARMFESFVDTDTTEGPATPMANSQAAFLPGGSNPVSGLALDTKSFQAGSKNANDETLGFKVPIITRIFYANGTYAIVAWREMSIAQDGRITGVSDEKGVYRFRHT